MSVDRDTPCIGVCTTLYDEVCRGCKRTAYEVDNWVTFTPEQKAKVWERLAKLEGEDDAQSKPTA